MLDAAVRFVNREMPGQINGLPDGNEERREDRLPVLSVIFGAVWIIGG